MTQLCNKILVVEDIDEVRKVVVQILRSRGYEVVEATSGKEAMKHLQNDNVIDLLFADIILPNGLNGFEVAEAATRLDPNLVVLFTSGFASNDVVRFASSSSDGKLLAKPYTPEDLLDKVKEVMKQGVS